MSAKYDLRGVLSPEERELLNGMLSMSPEAVRSLSKVINKFVTDRANSVLIEMEPAKVLIKKHEYDGAVRLAREINEFLGSGSHVV